MVEVINVGIVCFNCCVMCLVNIVVFLLFIGLFSGVYRCNFLLLLVIGKVINLILVRRL